MTSDTAIHFYFIFISIKTQQKIPYYDHGNKLTYIHMWFHGAFDFKLFLLILLMLLVCVCVFLFLGCCCCFCCTLYITILCNDQKKDKTFNKTLPWGTNSIQQLKKPWNYFILWISFFCHFSRDFVFFL